MRWNAHSTWINVAKSCNAISVRWKWVLLHSGKCNKSAHFCNRQPYFTFTRTLIYILLQLYCSAWLSSFSQVADSVYAIYYTPCFNFNSVIFNYMYCWVCKLLLIHFLDGNWTNPKDMWGELACRIRHISFPPSWEDGVIVLIKNRLLSKWKNYIYTIHSGWLLSSFL